ncbi:MAG TPA: VWA domain-containing protein [Blastocatellia bacterium]|nr:VWA domain-containing protein [Blastocatellia bacterium]
MAKILLLWLCLISANVAAFPQQPGRHARQGEDEPIKLKTTLAQVPVAARDAGGRYVTNLTREDFTLFEDGLKQNIEFFASVEEPFSVALVIDSSGSTRGKLDDIKAGANAFIDCLRPRDRVMVISFDDSVQALSPLTSDREELRAAVASIKAGEYTQVYEAVYTAVWEKLADVEGKKAVVIFTDGIDTASSEITLEDTLDAVIESEDVIVYPIRYNTRGDVERKLAISGRVDESQVRELDRMYRKADEYLFQLAEYSGGIVERADEISDLSAAFARIAHELRHQYVLGYYPRSTNGGKRRLTVTVSREGLSVRVRPRR